MPTLAGLATARAAAITMYEKCLNDHGDFAHANLCQDGALAPGGWFEAALRLRRSLSIPPWAPPPMPIKGADLAESIFGDPGARAAVDLDLLLPDPYFAAVCAALARRAGRLTHPSYPRLPRLCTYSTRAAPETVSGTASRTPSPRARGQDDVR